MSKLVSRGLVQMSFSGHSASLSARARAGTGISASPVTLHSVWLSLLVLKNDDCKDTRWQWSLVIAMPMMTITLLFLLLRLKHKHKINLLEFRFHDPNQTWSSKLCPLKTAFSWVFGTFGDCDHSDDHEDGEDGKDAGDVDQDQDEGDDYGDEYVWKISGGGGK